VTNFVSQRDVFEKRTDSQAFCMDCALLKLKNSLVLVAHGDAKIVLLP